jgi:LmbE family N-acetylglucosaminyl deacetylase
MKKILVVSAHADDETFGMGGTLVKLSKSPKNYKLYWLILSKIWLPKWNKNAISSRERAIDKISKEVNFLQVQQWDYKDNLLDTYCLNEMQEKMIDYLDKIKPNIIFTPSPWDFNFEHKIAFDLVEMSSKPFYSNYIEKILTYEIPSSTDSSFKMVKKFQFNYYVNIEDELSKKIELLKYFDTELHDFPHPRSKEYIKALSMVRGAESGMKHAEGFCIVRENVK